MKGARKELLDWLLFFAATFMLVAIVTILHGGLKNYLSYRKAVNPELELNFSILHFFTSEYIERKYSFLNVKSLQLDQALPSFYVYADEVDLASLDSDLPSSGKEQTVGGNIRVNNGDFSSAIDFR